MIKLGINGACGRMGRTVSMKILQQDDMAVITVFDNMDNPCLNADMGLLCGIDEWHIQVQTMDMETDYSIDAIIDFSTPAGLKQALQYARHHNIGLISGTTGLDKDMLAMLSAYSASIPIVYASNMSRGINETMAIIDILKPYLNDSKDIEIIEFHHNRKTDSPSGTALSLAERISFLTGRDIESQTPPSSPRNQAIRIHAVRAGSFSGIHKIIISDNAETLEITHTAHSREAFANGVIDAVRFIQNRETGLYSMYDVLKEH